MSTVESEIAVQDYFEMSAMGRSDLREIDEDPALYDLRRRGLAKPRPITEAMAFGSALAAYLTTGKGPDPLKGYRVVEFDSFRSNAAKEERKFLIENLGVDESMVITTTKAAALRGESKQQADRLEECVRQIRDTEEANKLILGCIDRDPVYQPILAWEDESGADLKSLPDRVIPGLAIVDLKTTAKPNSVESFMKQSRDMWYSTQAHMMQKGWQVHDGELLPVIFVIVRSVEPFNVEIIQVDSDYLNHGERRMRRAIEWHAECRRSGKWVSRTHNQITPAKTPSYWFNEFKEAA